MPNLLAREWIHFSRYLLSFSRYIEPSKLWSGDDHRSRVQKPLYYEGKRQKSREEIPPESCAEPLWQKRTPRTRFSDTVIRRDFSRLDERPTMSDKKTKKHLRIYQGRQNTETSSGRNTFNIETLFRVRKEVDFVTRDSTVFIFFSEAPPQDAPVFVTRPHRHNHSRDSALLRLCSDS